MLMLKAVQQSEQHRINIRQAGVLTLRKAELAAVMALGAIGASRARRLLPAEQMNAGTVQNVQAKAQHQGIAPAMLPMPHQAVRQGQLPAQAAAGGATALGRALVPVRQAICGQEAFVVKIWNLHLLTRGPETYTAGPLAITLIIVKPVSRYVLSVMLQE